MGLLLTAFGFGFRHGIDWDHLAALTDITGTERTPRRSMVLATLCAAGHAPSYAVAATCTVTSPSSLSTPNGSKTNSYVAPPSMLTAGVTSLLPADRPSPQPWKVTKRSSVSSRTA